jgi:D-serine deaminase-like pyridoxal phosphate-dependent protein
MAEVVRLMMDEGITKFKCATIAEAEMLGMEGTANVLLAYQPVGPKINRLVQLVKTYPGTTYSCLVDNLASAQSIGQIFTTAGRKVDVFIDLNVGMNRTGIVPDQTALELYLACEKIHGISPVGLHAYDGHLRDTDYSIRKEKCNIAFNAVTDLADQLVILGKESPILVAGGSPTFPIHAQREGVECSPGTFIFWDWGYSTILPEQEFQFAALVITRVISKIDHQTLCLDLGHKSIAAENPLPRVHFLNAPDAKPIGQSEEHLVVEVPNSADFQMGDVFYGIPVHICPTCALYEQAHVVENNTAKETWKVIARNRFILI